MRNAKKDRSLLASPEGRDKAQGARRTEMRNVKCERKGGALSCGLLKLMLAVWVCAAPVTGEAAAQPAHLIKFATLAPEGSTWMTHMRALDRTIREKSGDRLGFRIYAGGIAGDELDVLKKIRIGQLHAAAFSGVGFGQILPAVRVLDLPLLFRDEREIDRVHQEMLPVFARSFRDKGFELLAWAEVGNVHLFSRTPVRRMEDFAGLKVWAWSGDPVAQETFAAMGVNPIQLAVTDVLTALHTGMIDTVYAPPLGALALQWHTAVKFMTALPLGHATGAMLVAQQTHSRLSPALAELLGSEMRRGMHELTRVLRVQAAEAAETLQRSGVALVPLPDPPELARFQRVHEEASRRLSGRVFPPELLGQVQGILRELRQEGVKLATSQGGIHPSSATDRLTYANPKHQIRNKFE